MTYEWTPGGSCQGVALEKKSTDAVEMFPTASVAVAEKTELPVVRLFETVKDQEPSAAAVTVPRELSPTKTSTTLPASASPCIVGSALTVLSAVFEMVGASGLSASTAIVMEFDDKDVFPARSVAVALNIWSPEVRASETVNDQLPLSSTVVVPKEVSPLNTSTILSASAVPVSVASPGRAVKLEFDMTGTCGAVVSISNSSGTEDADSLPLASFCLNVTE